jgi:hypothetical protein
MTSIVLKNQECIGDKTPCSYNRTFTPKDEEIFVLAITNATLAVFFDVLENVKILLFDKENSIRCVCRVIRIYLFYKEVQIKIFD